MKALEEAKQAFNTEFGESVYDIKIVPKKESSEVQAVENVKKMEDSMVRRIESYLLGLEVPSLEFGVDHELIEQRNRENTQTFDQSNYEEQRDLSKLNSMSKFGQ